jgi:lipopolysaccharide export system protein LptA
VWTPKRILLLVGGFMLFLVAYGGYAATFFGRIDSLPPLPDIYRPRQSRVQTRAAVPRIHPINAKLEKAFGTDCPEIHRPIRLDLHSKNMVLSAEDCKFIDGRLQLTPISLALFGKDKGDGRDIEINTIKAKVAWLTFDRPINSPNEINGRKIIAAELIDEITIVNNRRTPSRDDDLVLTIHKGPLYYDDAKHLVWTHDRINLRDNQSKPDPTDIQGSGMEMELVTQPPPAKAGPAPASKQKNDTISGVKRIVLHADVVMHLYAAPGTGVMSTPKKPEPAKPAPKQAATATPPVPKEHIEIRTSGPFQYLFLKDYDLAQFDVPRDALSRSAPQDVTVTRFHGRGPEATQDQLICQRLELRLRKRDSSSTQPAKGAPSQDADQSLEIETAHAISANGKPVVLASDDEKLHAVGTDFFYDARVKRTILKGEPEVEANRDDSIIYAREMRIQEMKAPPVPGHPEETFQKIEATGPGSIHMMNKEAKKRTVHAYWNDLLTSTREGPNDLLILVGAARFVDDDHEQSLEARTLKVWLLPEDKDKKPAPKPAKPSAAAAGPPGGEQGRRPHHLEAYENVKSRARELIVHDTEKLVVWFKDVPTLPGNSSSNLTMGPPPAAVPPGGTPAAKTSPAGITGPPPGAAGSTTSEPPVDTRTPASPAGPSLVIPPPAGPTLGAPAPAPAPGTQPQQPPARPIDLSARVVEARVLRAEDKNQLDHLWCEGTVHVRQEPARPDEKAVDVKGDSMQMICKPEGNYLVVNSGDIAHLQMDKILIMGPEVNIDQATNRAWVPAAGAMIMESATNFQGARLDRAVPLEVLWNKDMYFNGEYAEFFGGIQASQENSNLTCGRMQVFFDRPVSLKEGSHSDQPARVRNLVCDKNVRVEDNTYDANKVLLKYQCITGGVLEMTSLDRDDEPPPAPGAPPRPSEGNQVRVAGPGDVRILQRGATDPLNTPAPRADGRGGVPGTPVSVAKVGPERRAAPQAPPGDEEMKMTYVQFLQRMDANSKTNTANFWGGVQVLNFPCDNAKEDIDLDTILSRELPLNWMYLRCDRLRVLDRPENGRSNQQLHAFGRVRVQTREYTAEAETVTYEERKDLVVFIGDKNNPATLTKMPPVYGGKAENFRGQKIFYIRSTGAAKVEGADSFDR